ncbi:MAG: thiamine-phosphate kinase [Candidatus Accumulibacter sp.]|nr:thiamine-phosphate kinase [Accumulibacter sp.]
MVSEFDVIARYFSRPTPQAVLGPGDDCALLAPAAGSELAISTDMLVEGSHFLPDTDPCQLGWKALAVNLSDLAAMGATPRWALLAGSFPEVRAVWLEAFATGFFACATHYGVDLVGGDTTRGPLAISVQVLGALPSGQALLRSGALVGDEVYVSGTLGDAAAALAFIAQEWRPGAEHAEYLLERFNRPRARLELGMQLLGTATAAIDISDGLLADAAHIAVASGVKITIDPDRLPLSPALCSCEDREAIVRWALTGGDDYELCFCLPAGSVPPPGTTRIGKVEAGAGVDCGLDFETPRGYQHFDEQ